MIRSYPFAMVFVVARLLLAVPAVAGLGEVGLVSVVWSCNAAACLVPTFVINWRALFPRRKASAAGHDLTRREARRRAAGRPYRLGAATDAEGMSADVA